MAVWVVFDFATVHVVRKWVYVVLKVFVVRYTLKQCSEAFVAMVVVIVAVWVIVWAGLAAREIARFSVLAVEIYQRVHKGCFADAAGANKRHKRHVG
jgi:hypothetical protein